MHHPTIATYLVMVGFILNAAVPPLHAWLPDAYGEATFNGSVFLCAFTTKTAVYALCLAVIGFALVAIIGVLPFGMNVQKDNRQETIVNQDATIFMNAIRNGERGFDDLTNYVMAITNYMRLYNVNSNPASALRMWGYTNVRNIRGGLDGWEKAGLPVVEKKS